MKLLIVLAVATLAVGDKLDRIYLPASPRAQSAGGSGNILQTPLAGPSFNDISNNFAPEGSTFGNGIDANGFNVNNYNNVVQNGNGLNSNENFASTGNGFAPIDGSSFSGLNSFDRPERPQAAFERNAAILRQYNSNDGETYSYGYETENGITAEESGVATNGVQAKGSYSYIGDDGQLYSVTYTADENGFVPQGAHIPTAPPVPQEIQKALEQNARDEAAGIFDDGSYDAQKYGTAVMPNSFAVPAFNSNTLPAAGTTVTDDAVVTNSALVLDNDVIRPPGYKNKGKKGAQGQTQGPQVAQSQGPQQGSAFQPINGFQSPSSNEGSFQSPSSSEGSFQSTSGIQSPVSNQGFFPVSRPQADSNANRSYLPPRRNSYRNGARRPSFNERTGYKY